jgi:serine/threonine-protein kinase
MKHVNEKVPDVQRRRRDVSSALAAVVERSTEKKPEKRYSDMNGMLADLEDALEVEVARAGRSTGEATTVLESVPRRQRLVTSRRVSIAGILLVLAATAAALLIAGLSGDDRERGGGDNPGGTGGAPTGSEVELTAASDFDPEGDSEEHGEEVKLAIDGIPNTAWSTETYTGGPDVTLAGKSGVGLVVETAEPFQAEGISVGTAQGGWSAEVYAATEGPPDDLAGWGEPVGSISDAAESPLIELTVPEPSQYYLIWFTQLADTPDGGRVEVSDVALAGA